MFNVFQKALSFCKLYAQFYNIPNFHLHTLFNMKYGVLLLNKISIHRVKLSTTKINVGTYVEMSRCITKGISRSLPIHSVEIAKY